MAGSVITGDGSTLLAGSDNLVLPFQAELAQASGRVVRLGSAVDTILGRHDYPEIVSKLLGEAVALTAMLGASLKFEGKFILQTNTDGPVDLLVVDFEAPGKLRGYARYDAERLEAYMQNSCDDRSWARHGQVSGNCCARR
jgi:molecular chaperone Hsp33